MDFPGIKLRNYYQNQLNKFEKNHKKSSIEYLDKLIELHYRQCTQDYVDNLIKDGHPSHLFTQEVLDHLYQNNFGKPKEQLMKQMRIAYKQDDILRQQYILDNDYEKYKRMKKEMERKITYRYYMDEERNDEELPHYTKQKEEEIISFISNITPQLVEDDNFIFVEQVDYKEEYLMKQEQVERKICLERPKEQEDRLSLQINTDNIGMEIENYDNEQGELSDSLVLECNEVLIPNVKRTEDKLPSIQQVMGNVNNQQSICDQSNSPLNTGFIDYELNDPIKFHNMKMKVDNQPYQEEEKSQQWEGSSFGVVQQERILSLDFPLRAYSRSNPHVYKQAKKSYSQQIQEALNYLRFTGFIRSKKHTSIHGDNYQDLPLDRGGTLKQNEIEQASIVWQSEDSQQVLKDLNISEDKDVQLILDRGESGEDHTTIWYHFDSIEKEEGTHEKQISFIYISKFKYTENEHKKFIKIESTVLKKRYKLDKVQDSYVIVGRYTQFLHHRYNRFKPESSEKHFRFIEAQLKRDTLTKQSSLTNILYIVLVGMIKVYSRSGVRNLEFEIMIKESQIIRDSIYGLFLKCQKLSRLMNKYEHLWHMYKF